MQRYTQPNTSAPAGGASLRALPSNVVVCPDASAGIVGCVQATAAVEQLYRRHFPGLPWLGEARGAGDGGGALEAVMEEQEEEALEDLLSALKGLAPGAAGDASGSA